MVKVLKERKIKQVRRWRRKMHIRQRVFGTAKRPRLSVYRSLKHIYAQLTDDVRGHTLVAASSLEKQIREAKATKTEKARMVGALLAERALKAGITQVVFDRNGFKYHGRVKALAEAAREKGLKF